MIYTFISHIRKSIISDTQEKVILKLIVKLLSSFPFGLFIFRINLILKKIFLLFGVKDQRAIEYPWVLRQLASIKRKSLVLDVGCSESLLSHEFIARGIE